MSAAGSYLEAGSNLDGRVQQLVPGLMNEVGGYTWMDDFSW